MVRCVTAARHTGAIRASNAFSWSMRATRTCRRKKRAAAFLWRPVPDVCLCACRIRSMPTFIDFAKIFDGFRAFELRRTSRNKRTNSELSPIFVYTRYFSYLFYFVLRYVACLHARAHAHVDHAVQIIRPLATKFDLHFDYVRIFYFRVTFHSSHVYRRWLLFVLYAQEISVFWVENRSFIRLV